MQDNFAQFDEVELSEYSQTFYHLVALSSWDLSVILSALRYAHWPTRWRNVADWKLTFDAVQKLEFYLMSTTTVEDLIKVNRMLIAALVGESVDLDADLPTGIVDYSGKGLAQLQGDNGNIAHAVEQLQIALENVKTAIETASPEDLEDDLANVWGTLQTVAVALGGVTGAPVIPL